MRHDHHNGMNHHPERFEDIDPDISHALPAIAVHIEQNREAANSARLAHLGSEAVFGDGEAEFNIVRRRKDASLMANEEIAVFRNAIDAMVISGKYRELVLIHSNMNHNMHSMFDNMGRPLHAGFLRFLPWHRRYLMAFETALQEADRTLRPEAGDDERPTVPYWRWTTPFPAWLDGYLPAAHPDDESPVDPRVFGTSNLLNPVEDEDVRLIIEDFLSQFPGSTVDNFTRFSLTLEGHGRKSTGESIRAHNHVHVWVGGIMGDTRYSPTDPVFWLHHCEVDRLWHIWQQTNSEDHPVISGDDRILDPWASSYDDVAIADVAGFDYESIVYP